MQTIDEQIQTLLTLVESQKADLAATEKKIEGGWKTNQSFSFSFGGANARAISSMSLQESYDAVRWLVLLSQAGELVSGFEGVNQGHYNGYPIDTWIRDFERRAAMIQVGEKRKRLESLESTLNSLVSPELRRKIELDRVMKELNATTST